jgi:hypothetical protein
MGYISVSGEIGQEVLCPTPRGMPHTVHEQELLYSSVTKGTPGPKGSSQELMDAIVELKQRNPRFGCRRIAQHIKKAFRVNIDKDPVRCVLERHYHPHLFDNGPSWLTFIGHTKDSLWMGDAPYEVSGGHQPLHANFGNYVVPGWLSGDGWLRCTLCKRQFTIA